MDTKMTVHRTVLFVLSMTFFLMSASGVMYAGIGGGPVIACTPFSSDQNVVLADVASTADGMTIVCGTTSSSIIVPSTTVVTGSYSAQSDGFIAKLSADQRRVEWIIYVGHEGHDSLFAVDVLIDGAIVAVGSTTSDSLEMPTNSVYRTRRGQTDGFIVIVSQYGDQIEATTYVGGSKNDELVSVALDQDDNIVVCGVTSSVDLPVRDAFDPTFNGLTDGFVAKLSRSLAQLSLMTYLGGGSHDRLTSLALNDEGNILVTGWTESDDYSVYIRILDQGGNYITADSSYDVEYNGGRDALITVLSRDGRSLVLSSFYGGSLRDEGCVARFDSRGNPVVLGVTTSKDLPLQGAFQDRIAGGIDGFIASLSTDGKDLSNASYIGASGDDIMSDLVLFSGTKYLIAGTTSSRNWQSPATSQVLPVMGASDVIVISLDGSGIRSATTVGGMGIEYDPRIVASNEGDFRVSCVSHSSSIFAGDGDVPITNSHMRSAGAVLTHHAGSINVTSPSGTDSYCPNTVVTVSWSVSEMAPGTTYSLAFLDSADTWTSIAEGLTTRSYLWTIPSGDTLIRLRLFSSRGHVSSTPLLRIQREMKVVAAPESTAVCAGEPVILHATASGDDITYQWKRNGTAISGAAGSSYTITQASDTATGSYVVEVSGRCGQVTSDPIHVRVVSATEIVRQPQDVDLKLGDRLELTCEANVDDVTVQWFHNEVLRSTATSATYVVESVTKADEGIYRCLVTGSCGTASTRDVTVSIDATTSAVDDQNNASFRVSIMNGVIHVEHAPGRIDRIDCVDVTGRQLRADDLRVFRGPAFVLVTLADGRQHRRTVVLP